MFFSIIYQIYIACKISLSKDLISLQNTIETLFVIINTHGMTIFKILLNFKISISYAMSNTKPQNPKKYENLISFHLPTVFHF